MTTVLIPLDSSVNSEISLNYYLSTVHREGNKVYTCYVADNFGGVGVMDGPSPGRIQELVENDNKKAQGIEDVVTEIFRTQHIDGSFKVLHGRDPWHKIINYAKDVDAGMIVMGSRGLGTIRRTVMGSVSESVLHHSDIPILICKHKK